MEKLDRYEILEEIGRGGFAVVYRARDTRMDREVALKVIAGSFAEESSFIRRFQQEAHTAANLRHPNIVPVHDFGDADGVLYLAMALIGAGHTLRDLLAEQAPLLLANALLILTPLAAALDYLHQHDPPLTHRDVKPANVLVEGEGSSLWVVLTDFGLVRSMQASTKLTQSGTILGTPAYMAPEQADPKQWGEVTPLTDVYALGVIAYEALTGRAPFEGEMPTVLHAQAYEAPPSPQEFLPTLGDDLSAALLRALAKPPEERYASAGAFVAALREVADAWTEAQARAATLEQLEMQAQELLNAGQWLEALDCCTQMVRLDPDRPAALEMLTRAKQGLDRERAEAVKRRRLEERYREGLQLLDEAKWKQALAAFEEVEEGNPDFRDVQEKLAQARDEIQLARWYDEAIAYGETERWAEACRIWVRILGGQPNYHNGEAAERLLGVTQGLLSHLDVLVDRLKQPREAMALDDALVSAIDRQEWERLLLQSAHNKRSGSLSKATRRFIGQLCQECAERQDATLLLAALDNPDHHVRRFAAKALGELGGRFEIDQEIIVPRLIEVAAEDKDVGTRWRAVWALGAIRPTSLVGEVRDLLCGLLVRSKENNAVRWRAAWALGEMKLQDAVSTLVPVALATGEAESVRRAAVRALGALQSPQAGKALREIASQEEGNLGKLAGWALQEVESQGM